MKSLVKNTEIIDKCLVTHKIEGKVTGVNIGEKVIQYVVTLAKKREKGKVKDLSQDLVKVLKSPSGYIEIDIDMSLESEVGILIPRWNVLES